MINTHVKLPGLDLKNPIMPASGTIGFTASPERPPIVWLKTGLLV